MENKTWTNAGINGVAPAPKQTPAFMSGSVSAGSLTQPAEAPQNIFTPISPTQLQQVQTPQPQPSIWQRVRFPVVAKILLPILLVSLLGAAGIIIFFSQSNTQIKANLALELEPAEISLTGLDIASGTTLQGTQSLIVNGSLVAHGGLVISPSSQPTAASAGQIYYDSTTNSWRILTAPSLFPLV